ALAARGAKEEFRKPVIAAGVRALGGEDWRGQEQSAILLAGLDHKPAAERLLQLLPARRREGFLTAAWALRKLAVPETLPAVLRYVETEGPRLRGARPNPERAGVPADLVDHQLSQLIQLLGRQKYRAADGPLRRFVPRGGAGEARAAAIWALGRLHEDKPV